MIPQGPRLLATWTGRQFPLQMFQGLVAGRWLGWASSGSGGGRGGKSVSEVDPV